MPRTAQAEIYEDVHFPLAGLDRAGPFGKQPARPVAPGRYARTTAAAVNVRGFQGGTNRQRGGSRPGLVKYAPNPVVAGWIIQELGLIVNSGITPPGGTMQQSNSGRVVTLVAVSQGDVYTLGAGQTTWTAAINGTGNTPGLNFTGTVLNAVNGGKMYFADGVNYALYDPSDNTLKSWTASVGTLPTDSGGNAPRLIDTWRGRTVVSGLLLDQQNWFMSAVNDPTNWDYAPLSPTPTQAIAGNNAPQGLIGDVVTGLCPYTDDVLVIFGDSSIWMFRGDPMAGGTVDLISDAIGGAWGRCWCKDPLGNIYFVSNRTGIFTLVPGQQPQRISQAIEQLIQPTDTGTNSIRLIWDDRYQGLHIFITPLDAPAATTHYFYEQRSRAWWQDKFANNDHNPLTVCVFDGNTATDRVALIGSWDGYVRAVSPDAADDDGTPIESEVLIGPILSKGGDDMMVKDIRPILAEDSSDVAYDVLLGTSAEKAVTSTAVQAGTARAGRNFTFLVRRAAHAVYIKLSSAKAWAMETIHIRYAAQGDVRRRRQS